MVRRLREGEIIAPTVGMRRKRIRTSTTPSRILKRSCGQAAFAGASIRCSSMAPITSTGCSRRSRTFAKTIVEVGTVGVVVSYIGEKGADLSGLRTTATASSSRSAIAACGTRRCCRANTPSTPTPAKIVPRPNDQFRPEMDACGDGKPHARREPVGDRADHQGRVRAAVAAVGRRAHRLHEGARSWCSASATSRSLVEQTLDPMVSAYFKNIGQTKTLIQLSAGSCRRSGSSPPPTCAPSSPATASIFRRC